MRISKLFFQSLREAPADINILSHEYLLRAGYIRPLASGIYSYLPLATRSIKKIETIIREEIEAIGGQEISMPVVHPADIWKESERWYSIDAEMGRFTDRNEREMVLAMTHEEVVADLTRSMITSYRQLPILVYQIQIKWRDDPRPRGGLIRTREFVMKDSYSLDLNWLGLDQQYRAHYQAYFNIFNKCGLDVMAVLSDTGMMGGKTAHEFMVKTPIGEDTLILCSTCGYSANRQIAISRKTRTDEEIQRPIEKVATPDCKTIEEVAAYLDLPTKKTAKAVFLVAEVKENHIKNEKLIFIVIRGDLEVNETKLSNLLKAINLRPATDDEILQIGSIPGYASPIGVEDVTIIADDSILQTNNLVAGGNEFGFHLKNVNYERDFTADLVADIATVKAGDGCPKCGSAVSTERAVEVGNIFKLGTKYSEDFGSTFQNENGELQPIVMGSYGIGIGRLLATICEIYHDDYGLTLPITVAPFQVHLICLHSKKDEINTKIADKIYANLIKAGIEVLYDDRQESAGIKFADADLIGIPIRLTLSSRSIKNGGIELKNRRSGEISIIPTNQIVNTLKKIISEEKLKVLSTLREVPYYE